MRAVTRPLCRPSHDLLRRGNSLLAGSAGMAYFRRPGMQRGEFRMAAQHGDANGFDMSAHTQTFNGFMKLVVWGIVGVVLVLLFLLWIHFA